jgi:hypothetical protein
LLTAEEEERSPSVPLAEEQVPTLQGAVEGSAQDLPKPGTDVTILKIFSAEKFCEKWPF